MQKYFLLIVLTVCVCDCWPNTGGSKTTLELSTVETHLIGYSVLKKTTQRALVSLDEVVAAQIFRTNDTSPKNYTETLTVPGNFVSPGSATRISPSLIETGPTSNLTARTGTKVRVDRLEETGKSFLSKADTNYLNATASSVPESMRRQGGAPPPPEDIGGGGNKQMADVQAANRFTTVQTTTKILKRTPPPRAEFSEQCDYLAHYCLRVYQTGRLCGRTVYHTYQTFKSYCMMDYVNCMERYEMWQLVHMGQCYNLKTITDYIHYGYHEDYFLDQDYVPDDQEWGLIG